jgi:predicted deacylase
MSQSRTDFSIRNITARPGEKASGFLEVAAAKDEGTRIPVTIARGSKPGPVIALVAGVHGYEYAPIIALQKILPQLDPKEISGTVILVHVANMPSFLRRTIYYSPVDGKNLNRVFPGKPDGTLTERIAHTLTKEIIERADYFVDIHCGDGNESLRPYLAYYADSPDPKIVEQSAAMALAFGTIDYIKRARNRPRDPEAAIYSTNAAVLRGKPTIAIESGEAGRTDHESVSRIERGVMNLLRHIKMIPGQPETVQRPVFIDRDETIRASVTGIFYPLVERGHFVASGQRLGHVTDFFGTKIQEVTAPFSGVVMFILATPPVSEGEPLVSLGEIAPEAR